ncbi:hypothetical protein JH271_08550 [Xanthomonas campestris pv. campestris]|uniref:hypothetical protein n=1 Tax=Xanthomonas campestris TaxID=339 RepID=UPI002379B65F|nr:hypothetical protein [Xanthomonas campestris]WDK56691.1 hypothetical protein JH301_12865 [Xanthomonas campestris pv. campestris]WDK64396.1 hypothetical protein JH271_08550 [Xanthomonas campestris pv. campestris]WDK68441.1 hypothetical protein JH258_08560 [Xanthomonas campestris pv. campestris]WDK72315.1 hypothetical protein JH284_07750 [Xanthomonas campestris pv. campestris]WDK76517.1 hypothetical protein JH294_08560 [Xanthomonas campestris pv. campestris]
MSALPPPFPTHTRPAVQKLPTPRTRFFWWYSLSVLFLGPFGFIVGPLMARRASRKAAVLYPVEALAAQARDTGFAWWQWWVMTPLTLLGTFWVFGLLSGLPMVVLVLWVQLMI